MSNLLLDGHFFARINFLAEKDGPICAISQLTELHIAVHVARTRKKPGTLPPAEQAMAMVQTIKKYETLAGHMVAFANVRPRK